MKSVWVSTTLVLALITTILVGCDEASAPSSTTVAPATMAGKGGTATIYVTPINKGSNIDSCLIRIKYNAPVIPADRVFDDSAFAVKNLDGVYTANFSALKTGEYYLYGTGWDNIRSERVRGGLPYVITDTNKATHHTILLQVKEY